MIVMMTVILTMAMLMTIMMMMLMAMIRGKDKEMFAAARYDNYGIMVVVPAAVVETKIMKWRRRWRRLK